MFRLSSSPEGRVAFGDHGACETVVLLLKKYIEEASIVEVALGVIKNLATECPANQQRFAATELGCAPLIVESMKTHDDGEATLQEMACLATEALATNCAENASNLAAAGICDALTLAEGQITNERNKTYPGRALSTVFP
jgi:hypothetical protein